MMMNQPKDHLKNSSHKQKSRSLSENMTQSRKQKKQTDMDTVESYAGRPLGGFGGAKSKHAVLKYYQELKIASAPNHNGQESQKVPKSEATNLPKPGFGRGLTRAYPMMDWKTSAGLTPEERKFARPTMALPEEVNSTDYNSIIQAPVLHQVSEILGPHRCPFASKSSLSKSQEFAASYTKMSQSNSSLSSESSEFYQRMTGTYRSSKSTSHDEGMEVSSSDNKIEKEYPIYNPNISVNRRKNGMDQQDPLKSEEISFVKSYAEAVGKKFRLNSLQTKVQPSYASAVAGQFANYESDIDFISEEFDDIMG